MIKYRLQLFGKTAYVSIVGDGTQAKAYNIITGSQELKKAIEDSMLKACDMDGHLINNDPVFGHQLAGAMNSRSMAPYRPVLIEGRIMAPRKVPEGTHA